MGGEIFGFQKLFSFTVRKKLGRFRGYGRSMFAETVYGSEPIFHAISSYGEGCFGANYWGDCMILSGIFKTDNNAGYTKNIRLPYYIPRNPRTPLQQAQRAKLADAVASWQNLTDDKKDVYNSKSRNYKMSGYNLYVREYLLSH